MTIAPENHDLGERFLRIAQVSEKCGVKRASIYRMMSEDIFPVPYRLAPKMVAWKMSELDEWLSKLQRVEYAKGIGGAAA
jgi:prophage regulatory protein